MPNEVTLAYSAKVVSPNNVANLAALMAGVELNYDSLPRMGASLVSDLTTSGATTATRTVTVSFFAVANYYPVTNHAGEPASTEGSIDLTTLTYGGGGSLNGQTLILNFANSGAEVEVTFGAPTDPADVLSEINAAFNPDIVATEDPSTHQLILTSPSASISVVSGSAVPTLGLTFGTTYMIPVNPFTGSIVSSSPTDSAVLKTGLQLVQINYIDAKGVGNFETAQLNGTTPVPLTATMKATIVSIVPITGTPVGLISIYTANPTKVVRSASPNAAVSAPSIPGLVPTVSFNPGYASGDLAGEILNNFTGTIVSTSNNDGVDGTGATTIVIDYLDALGNPHTDTVTLNGQTPVVLPTALHATIVSLTPNNPNTGIISIYTGDNTNTTGAPAATLPASFVSNYPTGTDQTAPFVDLYTHTLANGLGSVVSAAAPVVS